MHRPREVLQPVATVTVPAVRIAFTHAYCWPEVRRGGERFIQMLGAALVRRGHEVTILSSAFEPATSELDGVTTVRLRRLRRPGDAHERDFGRRVLPRLLAGSYDVVHSVGRYDAVASIRAARFHPNRRTVFTDLGLPDKAWWASRGESDARVSQRVVDDIDMYSCMSQWALDFLTRDYGRTDGVVVPGGVSVDTFVPAEREPVPTLLFSGAFLEPRKGAATLLEALPLLAEVEPEVRLWLSGPGDPQPLLDAAPDESVKRVEFLGIGDSARQNERYAKAWATCLPSIRDSFGMVVVESLACGTPIVVTTEGAPGQIVDPGVTGATSEPGNAEDLARACVEAIAMAREPQTVDACRAAAMPFDWDLSVAPLCESLYRSLGSDSRSDNAYASASPARAS